MTTKQITELVELRTPEDPSVLMGSKMVLACYNAVHEGAEETSVTTKVRDWIVEQALKEGWAEASFVGSQLLLNSVETPELTPVATKPTKAPNTTKTGVRNSAGSSDKNDLQNHKSSGVRAMEDALRDR